MKDEGPILDRLIHRLSECPGDFLVDPKVGRSGKIRVDAVVNDLALDLGGGVPSEDELSGFAPSSKRTRASLKLVLIACWLLHDDWFREKGRFADAALTWLRGGLDERAELVAPEQFVSDPDRREELVRVCLAAIDLRPAGESEAQAEDRRRTLDSVERAQLIRATRVSQERARRLREKMREEQAREAAAKVSREW